MRRTAVGGAILAGIAFLLILLGQALDLNLEQVALTGAALGAVVALVPDRPPLFRVAGAALGFLIAWGGYGVRAGLLPDTSTGRAIAALLVLLVLMGVSLATLTRIPLWSLLVGAAAMTASYETTFMGLPSAFPYDSPTAATQMALAGRPSATWPQASSGQPWPTTAPRGKAAFCAAALLSPTTAPGPSSTR